LAVCRQWRNADNKTHVAKGLAETLALVSCQSRRTGDRARRKGFVVVLRWIHERGFGFDDVEAVSATTMQWLGRGDGGDVARRDQVRSMNNSVIGNERVVETILGSISILETSRSHSDLLLRLVRRVGYCL
jgi:hypothetical protein